MSQERLGQDDPPDDDDGERLIAELLPKYNLSSMTHEEAEREMSALTVAEIAEIHADVSGAPGLSTTLQEALQLTVASKPSLPTDIDDSTTGALPSISPSPSQADLLPEFDTKINQIPIEKNSAYKFACHLNPQLANAKRKGTFLDYADGDAGAAALRMAQYWEARVELFGSKRAFESDLGMSKSDIAAIADRAVYRILPHTDMAGRAIICMYPGRRKFAEYSADDELRGFWYLLESLMSDDNLREKGVVFVMDGRQIPFEWMFSSRGSQITTLMIKSLPLKVKGIHLCYPNSVAGALLGAMKWAYSKEMRLRFRIHCGDEQTVLESLKQHSLPNQILPSDLGGDISNSDLRQFTMGGSMPSAFEESNCDVPRDDSRGAHVSSILLPFSTKRAALPAPLVVQSKGNDKIKSHATGEQSFHDKLVAMDRLFSSTDESCTVLPENFQLTDEEETMFINPREKGGRKSQPRMNKAVVMAIRYPKANRYEILVSAGFVFSTTKKMMNEKKIVDAEGISLAQRKNQLRRRIKSLQVNYEELKSLAGPAALKNVPKRGKKRAGLTDTKHSKRVLTGKKNTKRREK